MWNNWLLFLDVDGGSHYIFSADPFIPHRFGFPLLSQIGALVDNSLSKFTGALLLWFSNSNISRNIPRNPQNSKSKSCQSPVTKHITSVRHSLLGISFSSRPEEKSFNPICWGKISNLAAKQLNNAGQDFQSLSMLSLAAALVPPLGNSSAGALSFPAENIDDRIQGCIHGSPDGVQHRGYSDLSFHDLNWSSHVVEPRTGIQFPITLDNALAGENSSRLTTEVLVGTGSRTMTVIKIKSLKVYAFGVYVHPLDACVKLGQKYASVPVGEVNRCHDFYKDLLREDINMTVRLVVNYSGMKISTVRDAFEKSLRARLLKTNPDTDYDCLKTFGSLFAKDIPLRVGTTIDFRRTADGRLITEIGGNHIGAVQSKDLCRAFFDMYIGDFPVSEQTKEEIGRNVVSMLKRC